MQAFRPMLGAVTLALVAGAVVDPAAAQDIQYGTVSKVELGGSLGRVMRLVSGFGDPIHETVWITQTRMRTDTEENGSIMNADDGTITFLDHGSETYWTMDFLEMLEGMTQAMAGAEAVPAEADQMEPGARDSVHYEVHLSTDRTGRRESVAGYQAEQVFLTVEIEGEAYAEEGDSTVKGSLFVLSELWLSEEFPGHEVERAFHEAWAARLAQSYELPKQDERDMEPVFAHDPRLQEAMERLEVEMRELQGTALRSVSHFVVVPEGVEFDREAVLRDADKSLAADVGEAAARGVVSGARRRLGGLLGRNREEQPELKQAIVMRISNEIENVELRQLGAEPFQPPARYTERAAPGVHKP